MNKIIAFFFSIAAFSGFSQQVCELPEKLSGNNFIGPLPPHKEQEFQYYE